MLLNGPSFGTATYYESQKLVTVHIKLDRKLLSLRSDLGIIGLRGCRRTSVKCIWEISNNIVT